ncbi:AlbA family DNA-binding domain-containing protein [Microbacterium maritypicum]|uniref:Schlafen AlbA-2 domain-containing protein n=1 Tax=Microbacterium maritypicum TaxID=33918 RepID=A0A4Y4B4P8_MICMQ|nr:ATP-binding protein [Microbacterium liquefaciens]GEC74200.1 hypothetical protein MLI01_03450 [Microbacterium liquefaciens]GGV49589.1 hypothetical protein GCM10010213_03460 [Microbacterium liquefaciens]
MGIWLPTTEAEIETVTSAGTAPEGHFLDFKRELGSTPGSRKETAQDIASFALDGGVLIVGVDEPEPGTYKLSPQPLSDLSERAEQIAANRPDPGLYVRTAIIPSRDNPSAGYLVVEVPPSPAAPHMVDGRYWGRSERTKRQLNDAEVARFHAARARSDTKVLEALEEELARDPEPRPASRMLFVAEPLVADGGLARSFVRGPQTAVRELTQGVENRVPGSVREYSPTPWELSTSVRRAKGIALTGLAEGRKSPSEAFLSETATDIEVQTSGAIRGVMSRLTYLEEHPRVPEGTKRVIEGLPIAWSHRLVAWAGTLGEQLMYRGPWGFGVHLYGLEGVCAAPRDERGMRILSSRSLPVYEVATFQSTTTASFQEIQDDPLAIVDRLIGDFIHSLGVSSRYPDCFPGQ